MQTLEIRSCNGENGLSLPDAKMLPVKSTADVLNLMKIGEVNRVVSSTAMNNRSSRSHSVLTVHVHGKDTSGSTLRSCLHLVDLAGSERVDKSEVTGDRLKEAQYINKSLSCLGDVVAALAQKNSHIPYRNSKLTLLLQDSLGGHAKTLMFAHVGPEADSFGETISTLKFAQRVSTVELGAARANKESSEIMQLKEQVENLKKALASKEAQGTEFHKLTDLTPPRLRRLSIENGSTMKSQTVKALGLKAKEPKSPFDEKPKATDKTPPRLNGFNRIKEPRSPAEKPNPMTEKTPPRVRRLNIENDSNMKSQTTNPVDRRRLTPTIPTRSRRLSLEGPRYSKKTDEVTDGTRKPLVFEAATRQKCDLSQDPEAVSKMYAHSATRSSMMEVYHLSAPKSPTSFSHKKRSVQIESKTQIPVLQLPVTPLHTELPHLTDSQTTNFISANGRGSQIRKSLRTIGKLINGSDKRNQQNSKEAETPINSRCNEIDVKSPVTGNARAGRRQSLTGVQGFDRSRRSSLGGKSDTDDPRRNARTPPPIRMSTKR
ncbi:Kinesin-like protein KIN-14L [Euphorbia peplus]|nr:Kinesin-like protein KIN-14L [Euphorbia peplus]